MKSIFCSGLFFLLTTMLFGQLSPESLLSTPFRIIHPVPLSTQLEVDEEQNLILLDQTNGQLFKYLYETDYDSILIFGGKSVRNEGLQHPVKISTKSRQSIFVLDDIQRRILILNKDFRMVEDLNFFNFNQAPNSANQENEIIPQSFDVTTSGEIFVLSQLNNKVYKISPFRELEASFGGLDFGEGSLYEPTNLQINEQNFVFVGDTSSQVIQVFDQFGTFRYTMRPKTPFRWSSFNVSHNTLICFHGQGLYIENLMSKKHTQIPWKGTEEIMDVKLGKDFIYLLLENAVNLYRIN